MWEKIRVIFTIPELRQKILLTALFLAIYRVGWQVALPMVDSRGDAKRDASRQTSGLGSLFSQAAVFSASQLSSGDDFRPGHHAVHFGLDYFPIAGQRLGSARTTAERRRKRPQKNQRIHPLRHGGHLHRAKAGVYVTWIISSGWISHDFIDPVTTVHAVFLAFNGHDHHDLRNHLFDVAGRANRRVRHRQRHQLADHGGHSGQHAGRRRHDDSKQLPRTRRRQRQVRPGKMDRAGGLVRRYRGGRRIYGHKASAAFPRKAPSMSAAADNSVAAVANICRSKSINRA